jgi:hypothetical protein
VQAFYYSEAQANAGKHGGCNGGNVITTKPGAKLTEAIVLSGSQWHQTVTDETWHRTSTYNYSLKALHHQYPDRTNFDIEIWNTFKFNNHLPSITFENTQVTATTPFPSCTLTAYMSPPSLKTTGTNSASTPVKSNGGKTCSYALIKIYPMRKFIQPKTP